MSHTARFVLNVVIISAVYLVSSTSGQESNPSQTDKHIIAEHVNATASLNIKGAIFVDELDKTPRHADDVLPVKFIYSSVESSMRSYGFVHTDATSQIRERLISDLLKDVLDLKPVYRQLIIKKPVKNAFPLATFSLRLASRSDGYISNLANPEKGNQERLVFHEQTNRMSGLASVNICPQYDPTDSKNFRLCLSILEQFSKLASDLACQNIWVTIRAGNDQQTGLCWKDGFEVVSQETP